MSCLLRASRGVNPRGRLYLAYFGPMRFQFAGRNAASNGGLLADDRRPWIKQLVRFGLFQQQRARLEPLAQRGVFRCPIDQPRGSLRVAPAEDPAAERRE